MLRKKNDRLKLIKMKIKTYMLLLYCIIHRKILVIKNFLALHNEVLKLILSNLMSYVSSRNLLAIKMATYYFCFTLRKNKNKKTFLGLNAKIDDIITFVELC